MLPEIWTPDPATERIRSLVARRYQVVRHRTRIKNEVHSILHVHLIPKCPHADLFNARGRDWLARQPVPADERAAIERHAGRGDLGSSQGAGAATHVLRAHFMRIRAKRGLQIAAVALARKLTVLCWRLLTKEEDYLWALSALVTNKMRTMELQAGLPQRKDNRRGASYACNVKELRDRERQLAEQAECSYEHLIENWKTQRPRNTVRERLNPAGRD
ncbi:transposase [Acidocella aminolytica 101 = DSM 11237]|uniref:Transposase n=2 Tax=Acidocella TaxID=50709 RepID=A0A0D6PK67_9PROT|nr:transposase [Acidocella aminolytica 101 = DSM 11237]